MIHPLQLVLLALQTTFCLQVRVAVWSADHLGPGPLGHVLQPISSVAKPALTKHAANGNKRSRTMGWTPARQSGSSLHPNVHAWTPAGQFSSAQFSSSLHPKVNEMNVAITAMTESASNPPPKAQRFSSQFTSKAYYATGQFVESMNVAMQEHALNPPPRVKVGTSWDPLAWDPLAVGALAAYTTPAFKYYNQYLREGNTAMLKQYGDFTSNLLKGLKCLPPFHGTVYRGVCHTPKLEASIGGTYVVGMEVVCDGFTSTSVDRAQADSFSHSMNKAGDTIWEIKLRADQARLIDDFSTLPNEREVLLPPGAKLKVIGIEKEFLGKRIVMEEVLPSETDTPLLPKEEFYAGRIGLHLAAKNGLVGIAETLMASSDASVNLFDVSGQAPLHYAAEYGHAQMIELLVASKADVNIESDSGLHPLQLALQHDKSSAAQVLLEHNSWFLNAGKVWGLRKPPGA